MKTCLQSRLFGPEKPLHWLKITFLVITHAQLAAGRQPTYVSTEIFIFIHSRICLFRHLKRIRKKRRIRQSEELCKQVKTIIEAKLIYFIIVTRMHSALISSKIRVYDDMVEYNN